MRGGILSSVSTGTWWLSGRLIFVVFMLILASFDADGLSLPMTTPKLEWNSKGKSQNEFMKQDQCILVDANDRIVGFDSKENCHRFTPLHPRGKLHRAFSVFMFDSSGNLLLQRRSKDKVTFPGVWTNACCSHQLYSADEIDAEDAVLSGNPAGTIRAARRKLEHELGLLSNHIADHEFKFAGRILYYAVDRDSAHKWEGRESAWGEAEVDYILLLKASLDGRLQLNPSEVFEVKLVDQATLKSMLEDPAIKWSPWFRMLAEKKLFDWWDNMKVWADGDTMRSAISIDILQQREDFSLL